MNHADENVEPASFMVNRTTIFQFDSGEVDLDQSCILQEYPSEQVADWLRDVCSAAARTTANTTPCQIQLVLLNLDLELWDSHEQMEGQLDELTTILGVPHGVFESADIRESQFYPPDLNESMRGSSTDSPVYRGSIVQQREGIAWSHFTSSGCTTGVAWHRASRNEGSINYLVSHMAEHRSIAFHPALLPLLQLRSMTDSLAWWQENLEGKIFMAQIESGFHDYTGDQPPGAPDPDVDFGVLSARVSGCAANTSSEELCLRGLLNLASTMKSEYAILTLDRPSQQVARSAQRFVDAQVTFLERRCESLLQRAVSWQRQAAIVIQGIFNLIAQRDQQANLRIADESKRLAEQGQRVALASARLAHETKRDSASMKAIAAVTMCFLPGTFVASFLAMPIFQLDSHSQKLTTRQMWLYWTITVPLTLVTIGAWYLWDRRSTFLSRHPPPPPSPDSRYRAPTREFVADPKIQNKVDMRDSDPI